MDKVYIIIAVHTRRYADKVFSERRPVAVAETKEIAEEIISQKKFTDTNVKYVIQKWDLISSPYGMSSL